MTDVSAERGKQNSSRVSERGAGWVCAEVGTFRSLLPSATRSFTWLNPLTLWRSRNEILAGLVGDPSPRVRRLWIDAQRRRGVDPHRPITPGVGPDFSFIVLGDPGEGDASQYAVVPGLLRAGAGTDFAVVASDVVYPTGSPNDYPRTFFRPYRDYPGPIYAVPGNHDWYDGLGGFMRVFCDSPPLDGEVRPAGPLGLLWRRPERADERVLARGRELRSGERREVVQPAPYWTIDTPRLLVVGVDTGIRAALDAEQGAWLRRVSADPRPKVLITGKPIYVNNAHHPCPIEGGGTVDDVVRAPEHRYVAAIGGDVHNYQRYPVDVGGGRIVQYVVSGGAGAFTHATHTVRRVDVAGVREDDYRCYPLRGDSLSFYSLLYSRRLRMRWLYLRPEEAACIMREQIGNDPVRPIAERVTITRRMRWAARLLGAWPMPFRLPVGRTFHHFLSELADWDTPPFFKSFLRVAVSGEALTIRCYAATGCLAQELEPPVEDEVRIPLR